MDQLYALPEGTRVLVLAPIVKDRKGEHEKVLAGARQAGFARVRVNGEIRDLDEDDLARQEVPAPDRGRRRPSGDPSWSVRNGGRGAAGRVPAGGLDRDARCAWRRARSSSTCRTRARMEPIACTRSATRAPSTAARSRSRRRATSRSTPRTGRAPLAPASGAGSRSIPDLVLPDPSRTIREGAIVPWRRMAVTDSWFAKILDAVAKQYRFSTERPVGGAERAGATHPPPRQRRGTGRSSATSHGPAPPTTSRRPSRA